ncbi:MAG TPA: ATP-binding cassette domain-containing protein [Chloroflexota bacterium]
MTRREGTTAGLNGAGKSTTIRKLLGMIRPAAGYVQLGVEDLHVTCRGFHDRHPLGEPRSVL